MVNSFVRFGTRAPSPKVGSCAFVRAANRRRNPASPSVAEPSCIVRSKSLAQIPSDQFIDLERLEDIYWFVGELTHSTAPLFASFMVCSL